MNRKTEDPSAGHRIIEIGCIEIIDFQITGSVFHKYISPQNTIISKGAFKKHGISNLELSSSPTFSDISSEFISFISGAVIVFHNSRFDIAFLDSEFKRLSKNERPVATFSYEDTLEISRRLFPGEKNDLDSLKERFKIPGGRDKHGALKDALITAQIYLHLCNGGIVPRK